MVRANIIQELKLGSQKKQKLIAKTMSKSRVTIQAVYKVLRKLVADDIVLIKGETVSLTPWYIEGQLKSWKAALDVHSHGVAIENFLDLERGKKLTTTLKTLNELDSYWTQAFLTLERILPESFPVYAVIPHDWFYYAKPQSDRFWTRSQKRLQRLVITHPQELDMQVVRLRRNAGYQTTCQVNPLRQNESTYFTLLSDWIFEVRFDSRVNEELVKFIKTQNNLNDLDVDQVKKLIQKRGIFKVKIDHNPDKAKRLIKKVAKYFE